MTQNEGKEINKNKAKNDKDEDVLSIMAKGEDAFVSPLKCTSLTTNATKDPLLNTQKCLSDPHIRTSEGGWIGTSRGGRTDGYHRCSTAPTVAPATIAVMEKSVAALHLWPGLYDGLEAVVPQEMASPFFLLHCSRPQ